MKILGPAARRHRPVPDFARRAEGRVAEQVRPGQHRNRWHPSRIRMAFGVVANHHDPQYRQSRLAGKWRSSTSTPPATPDAVSRVSIHIITDIFPVLVDAAKVAWRSGQPSRA
ncbi:hypothetical protein BZL30_9407 [Mycobacterium kansasii]|uniref:Uncharacterized protein n=1 Tax=Mycobacterium kansasii TaxID=1768 RepID=A0A1V3WA44_MYCKA|nr:hypothetical protein BZL30_9407 [Mycobacterium kansasii]